MKKFAVVVLLLLFTINTSVPIAFAAEPLSVIDVSSGGFFGAVLLSDNSLWMWGNWFYIGPDSREYYDIAQKIMTDVKDVSCGRAHTLILKNNGDLYAMGLYGGLGLSDIVGDDHLLTEPTKIMSDVKYIDAGGGESCAVTTDGSLYYWYDDFQGNASTQPIKVMSNVICATVGAGYWLAVKEDNTLWACGSNEYGQLGDGTTEDKESPVKIMDDVKFVDTAYWGWSTTAAIKTDSTLWTWGLNNYGQLGNNGYYDNQVDIFYSNGELFKTRDVVVTPKKILDNVKSVYSAPQYMCAVLNNGDLYEWGNLTGSLEEEDGVKTPVYLMSDVEYAENANHNGIALKNDGTSWVWMDINIYDENGNISYDVPAKFNILDYVVYPVFAFNSLTNQNNAEITSDNIADLTKIKLTLLKTQTSEQPVLFLVAFYDADKNLICVSSKEATVSTDVDEVEIDITKDVASAHRIKVFAWKNLTGMQPICEIFEEDITID